MVARISFKSKPAAKSQAPMARNKKKIQQSKKQQPPLKKLPPAPPIEESSESESDVDLGRIQDKSRVQTLKNDSHDDEDDDKSSGDDSSSNSDDDDDDDNEETTGKKIADAPIFSDQNASWLKPKPKATALNLLESDEDSDDDNDRDSNDDAGSDVEDGNSDEDDDEEELDVERDARVLDQEIEEEQEEADEEMRRTIRDHTAIYHLPTETELARNVNRVVPPSEIRSHIDSILEVLSEFKARREPGRARKDYIDQLGSFMAELYGYLPELIEYFLMMLGPAETVEFVEQSDKPRPLVIRTNTLKTRRKDLAAALMKRGVTLDPLAPWSKVGLKISESPVPIGATPEYLSGYYMLQSAASMCSVMALAPEPQDRVMDMSSAPGGKTSYMAQLMRNTGVIIANDLKAERQKATVANLHRLGVKNVVACAHDGRKLGTLFPNRFDRVLLDAPCSGLGVISRDPSVKFQRTMADVNKCAHLQKELLLAAIDALKFKGTTGGVMVYSTCSVSVAENEEVIQYALTKRDIRLIETGLDFGRPGFTRFQDKRFHPSVALTRRFYPHVHNMDGFFVAKIQKLSDGRPGTKETTDPEEEVDQAVDQVTDVKEEDEDKTEAGKINSKSKFTKKRKHKNSSTDSKSATKTTKNPLVSIPPTKPKTKKQKLNAKISKPRRQQSATDA